MNRKLKKAVIREEFVVLTGDYIKAIILNQFLYWTDRINDIDNFIAEERKRLEQEGLSVDVDLQKGWIYKTAEDLLDEIMLGMAQTTIRVHIKKLLETGYLLERNNPKFKWDKTKQYRVDLLKIQTDLFKLGYALQGYKLPLIVPPISETKLPTSESELREYENRGAIPDIIADNTPKITLDIYISEFENWFKEYPNKKGKSNSEKYWVKLRKENISVEQLTLARDSYNADIKKNDTQPKFIMMCSTFLGPSKRWEDFLNTATEDNKYGFLNLGKFSKYDDIELPDDLPDM